MEIDEGTVQKLYSHQRGLEVLVDKTIVFLGDSVMRGMYKDMVKFVKCGEMLQDRESKRKGELSFHDDILVYGGDKLAKKTNGKEFREYRVIKMDNGIIIKYHYICRAYNDHMESIIDNFLLDPPDIIVVNSCLWDLHRYEKRTAMESFKENVLKLAKKLSEIKVPSVDEDKQPLLIWTTTPPCECDVPIIEDFTEVSDDPNAYNFTAQIDELNSANIWLGQMLPRYAFTVIDLGTVMAKAIHNRERDGVHWNGAANRMFIMLILSRVELHMGVKQQIPTVIYSPLLFIKPPAAPQPVPARSLLPNPAQAAQPAAAAPYAEHQYYEGMGDFNDRYGGSFNQAQPVKQRDYYDYDNREEYCGPGGSNQVPDFSNDYPPEHGAFYGAARGRGFPPGRGRGRGGPFTPEDRYSNPYNEYNNNYTYNDVAAANMEARALRNGAIPQGSRPRGLSISGEFGNFVDMGRRVQLASSTRDRTLTRQVQMSQHRPPPVRHVPPPRQNRRQRPY